MKKKSILPRFLLLVSILCLILLVFGTYLPVAAEASFGTPSPQLSIFQRFSYSVQLILNAGNLVQPVDVFGSEQLFIVDPGESVFSVSNRLEAAGLIADARVFRVYLVWSGMDAYIQTGMYRLSPSLTALSIAGMLQTTTLTEILVTILPGWRMEEIAASLPTTGLSISPEEFLLAATRPGQQVEFIPAGSTVEGFLFPDTYILPRTTTVDQLISVFLQRSSSILSEDLRTGFSQQGLTVYQAVTLASIIEREAVIDEEMPTIASVFYNRLAIGMKLQTDPTVQYAIGYNPDQGTWWTNPLSVTDLQVNSPFNTYQNPGLPPSPISNPGMAALTAVANPARTAFYFFQARCDGSGWHNFAETFEQHEQNYCP